MCEEQQKISTNLRLQTCHTMQHSLFCLLGMVVEADMVSLCEIQRTSFQAEKRERASVLPTTIVEK